MQDTTIAALSTPQAAGGIAVLRISGQAAISCAENLFRPIYPNVSVPEMKGYTCAYGTICDGDGKALDDGILTVFRAPHSYTGEDVAEISCHGGIFLAETILNAIYRVGAIPAETGEFTKRAFLAGKMDLTQAESVMDLIGATNRRELDFVQADRRGALSNRVNEIRDGLVHLLADLAAWSDYPEDDIPAVTQESLETGLTNISAALSKTLSSYEDGEIMRGGIKTAIVGAPNVGKSTLFNALCGSEKSIVTAIPGTTRDTLEGEIRLGDMTLRLYDTAGIRETSDEIERIGVARARERLENCDLIFAVEDANHFPESRENAEIAFPENVPVIFLLNKMDTNASETYQKILRKIEECNQEKAPNVLCYLPISAKTGVGLDDLQKEITSYFQKNNFTPEMGIVLNARQRQCLVEAKKNVDAALGALQAGELFDAITVLLDEAADALLSLTGQRVTEAVVNDVFSRFCVGK